MGFRYVLLETNSSCVYHLVTNGVPDSHVCSFLVRAISNLLKEEWQVELRIIFREANRCADCLAKFAHKLPRGITFFDGVPNCVSLAYLVDSLDHGVSRCMTL